MVYYFVMRTLLKLGVLLVVGLLAYNYFLGTPEEKEQSRVLVGKAKELGSEAWKLLKSEREKASEGKYNATLDRLEALYKDLRKVASDTENGDALRRLDELGQRRETLEEQLDGKQQLDARAQEQLDELTAETEDLMHEMEAQSQPPAPY